MSWELQQFTLRGKRKNNIRFENSQLFPASSFDAISKKVKILE